MKEFFTMLERKYPGAHHSNFYRANGKNVARQVAELGKLQARRPDVYEAALIALVDWVGTHAQAEFEAQRRHAVRGQNDA